MYLIALTIRSTNVVPSERKLWGATIASAPPEVRFDDVMSSTSPKGLADLTSKIARTDYVYIKVINQKLTMSSVSMGYASLPTRQKRQRRLRSSWKLSGLYETRTMAAFTTSFQI